MSTPCTRFTPALILVFASLSTVAWDAPAQSAAEPPATASAASSDAKLSGCGFVSSHQAEVPESASIFSANITQIDGKSTSFMRSNRQQVPVGSRTLTVSELIDQNRFTQAQLVQLRKMKKYAYARAYKPLVVEVKPNTNYRIGARLLTDKLDTESIKANAYWEPVIWEEVAENCP